MGNTGNDLISDLIQGKEQALKRLFDEYADEIYDIALRILKDTFESEDVVQEVVIKIWNARERLDETRNIRVLIYVVTKRLALNKLRNLHLNRRSLVSPDEACLPDDRGADSRLHLREIELLENDIVHSLPQQQQRAYLMSRQEYLSHQEIATRMGISPHTVRNHIVNALKVVRAQFQKFGYPIILFFLTS